MTKSRIAFLAVSAVCLAPFLTATLRGSESAAEDSLYKYLSVFTEVLSLVQKVYVEETSVDGLLAGALDGATDALDPLAMFVPPDTGGGASDPRRGAAVRSGMRLAKERGICFVAAVATSGAAEQAGVRAGDVVTEVDGVPTRRTSLWELHSQLARNPGETFELTLLRQGQTHETSLVLAEPEPRLPAIERVDGVPVLRVHRYDDVALAAVERELAELAAAGDTRLLLDLRGGIEDRGEAGFELARRFVSGPLGELRQRGEVLEAYAGDGQPSWSGELVVLVDRGTFGAAEVAAVVLQQREVARLVGEATFGHAGRQRRMELSGGGELLLADAFFAGPDGETVTSRTRPDVVVRESSRAFGEDEKTLRELIFERGIELLSGESSTAESVA